MSYMTYSETIQRHEISGANSVPRNTIKLINLIRYNDKGMPAFLYIASQERIILARATVLDTAILLYP